MKKRKKICGIMISAVLMAASCSGQSFAADAKYVTASGQTIEGALQKGISISKYQNRAGEVNWQQIAASGIQFAMVRMGYFQDLDPYFDQNMNNAAANGIKTGIFFYTQALNVETAAKEAAFVLETIKDYPVSYPVAYDVESQHLLDQGISKQQLTDQINTFCSIIAAAGYQPLVYGNQEWLNNHMDTSQIPYDIWYARYGSSHEYPNRTIWQSTDSAQIAGITGNVCLEFAFKDYNQNLLNTGWRFINGDYYYYKDYIKQTGWIQDGEKWYYLAADGKMVHDTTMTINQVSYQFGGDGAMLLKE